jgi:hypothetical protein
MADPALCPACHGTGADARKTAERRATGELDGGAYKLLAL